MLIGDFNCEPTDPALDTFLVENNLYCHIKTKTCFKASEGTCIDLILSNQTFCLQNTGSTDTGFSDFRHLIYTQLKSKYETSSRKVSHRYYGNFVENDFLVDLSVNITSSFIDDYELFEKKFIETLDRHAPRKTKLIRGNEKPHMNKALRKAIMIRSRLRNIYIRSRRLTDLHAYRKQRNYVCSLNIKTRRIYLILLLPIPANLNIIFGVSVNLSFLTSRMFQRKFFLFIKRKSYLVIA